MCALYGWLGYGKKLPHRFLKKLTQALANTVAVMGHTGLATQTRKTTATITLL